MLRLIALRRVRAHKIGNTGKTLLENKQQQIMQNNMETQNKHTYSLYIGSLCLYT